MSTFLDQDFGSDSEDDFNPEPELGSDDENSKAPVKSGRSSRPVVQDEDDEDEDGEPSRAQRTSGSSRARHSRSGEADDEDNKDAEDDEDLDGEHGNDDDEDDEDEDDEGSDRPRKRPKRNQFIDLEAEVSDEGDEEDDEEDDLDDLIDKTHPDDAADIPAGAEHDDRRHRELDQQRQRAMDEDAEKQAEALRQKYGRQSRANFSEVSAVPQHLLLPSVDDPSIWVIKCKLGKEDEVVNSIMKRWFESQGTKEQIDISAAFARGGAQAGFIYIEARRQDQVMKATENMINAYPRTMCRLIPIAEMPSLLYVKPPKPIEVGQYVRLKRPPLYVGDLAQIVNVDGSGTELTVRIVPRLEYEDTDVAGIQKRKRPGTVGGRRPPQKLFNEADARKKEPRYLHTVSASSASKRAFSFHNEIYEDGFLLKDYKLGQVQTEEVNPTLEEITKFATDANNDEIDIASIAATLRQSGAYAEFLPNDAVQIWQGEQSGVKGRVSTVQNEIVTLKVSEGVLKGKLIEAPVRTLRKLFNEGDHVKVTGASKYIGEVGMVVRVKDDKVTLVTDANNEEITVFSRDLRAAADSAGPMAISKYELFDLIRLDVTTVGCIVRVDRETLRVLDQNGSVRTVLPSSISGKIENRHPIATDRAGNEIRREDTVKEVAGQQRIGEVIHIHQTFLWLRNRLAHAENTGVFVVRSSSVNVTSAKGGRVIESSTPDLTKMNPELMRRNPLNNGGMMPPPRNTMGRDNMISKYVRIKFGPFKGHTGFVKDATPTLVKVELHSKKNVIPVERQHVSVIDPETGKPAQQGGGNKRWGAGGNVGALPSRTPVGARTPYGAGGAPNNPWGKGSATPAWGQGGGNKTPFWGSGARTPFGAGNDGSRTVNPYSNNDGSRTAYGGSGWGSGSKTPAYSGGASAPTPGASGGWGAANAATPAALDAPTPAGYLAPTPGAMDAPTPRAPYNNYTTPAASAPTPGAFAETPGAFAAETPGAFNAETPAAFGGDDDEPRYA